jgi:hypothetical protein
MHLLQDLSIIENLDPYHPPCQLKAMIPAELYSDQLDAISSWQQSE